jgi:hypothetical protein
MDCRDPVETSDPPLLACGRKKRALELDPTPAPLHGEDSPRFQHAVRLSKDRRHPPNRIGETEQEYQIKAPLTFTLGFCVKNGRPQGSRA